MKIYKLIRFLLFFALVLFLVNVLLMFSIERNDKMSEFDLDFHYKFKMYQDSYRSIFDLPMDKSGQYYVHKNFIRSEKTHDLIQDVVLTSHCTGNHLHHLNSLSETWQGPISIAVFVPGYNLETTLSTLYILYQCFVKVRERVSIHLVHPVSELLDEDDPMFHIRKAKGTSTNCTDALAQILNKKQDFDQINYATKTEYPNNLLRNIARRSINTQYSLTIDVDMTPSQKLYNDFLIFAKKNKLFQGGNSFYDDKSVFVLPAFEANMTENLPQNKASLVSLLDNGKVRPFYYDICWKCQKQTNYERWKNLGDVGNNINVGYEVNWKDPWEPFFIAPKSSPDFDERFKQYGFNRISQACELHVAGFKFFILDRGFVLHQGFKNKASFHKSKDQENESNRILFLTFKTELKLRYPHSRRRCY